MTEEPVDHDPTQIGKDNDDKASVFGASSLDFYVFDGEDEAGKVTNTIKLSL